MNQPTSLSRFLSRQADFRHGDEHRRLSEQARTVEAAERAFDRSLSPAERAERDLVIAYETLRRDTARLDALTEIAAEDGGSAAEIQDTMRYGQETMRRMAEQSAARVATQRLVVAEQIDWLIARAVAFRATLTAPRAA